MTTRTSVPHVSALSVHERWDALLEPGARAPLERALPAWVAARRWYRTKTKKVQSACIRAAFRLPYGEASARITLVELALDDGTSDLYVVPLAFVGGDDAAFFRSRSPQATVMSLAEGLVVDALVVAPFLSALLLAIAHGGTLEDDGWVLSFHGSAAASRIAARMPTPMASAREQTNTSIAFDEKVVAKIVRKLDEGESPDLEVGRFLTTEGFVYTPAVAGWIEVRRRDFHATAGLLHIFVPNRGDAWEHALSVLDPWLDARTHRDAGPPRSIEPSSGDALQTIGPYVSLAEILGHRVGEMHVVLASRPDEEAFAPELLDESQREAITRAIHDDLSRTLGFLGARAAELPDAARSLLADVRARLTGLEGRLARAMRVPDGGVVTRVHGDLHLGQVLFTGTDFAIIDFEGEPARPLAERRRKRSPLVDVAGMIRSFHYASVAALRGRPEATRAALAPWAAYWYRAITASFLRGWLGAVQGTIVPPKDPAVFRALLDVFLLEKCVYELAYELNHRPDWVEIPLAGLRDLVEREPAISAAPQTADVVPALTDNAPPTLPSGHPRAPMVVDPASPAVRAFLEGTATHAHRLLGAHARTADATDFVVWAPSATSVSVVGDFDDRRPAPLEPIAATGLFGARVVGARPGHRYELRIASRDGVTRAKADPFGTIAEPAPGGGSVIAAPKEHAWGDDEWMRTRLAHARLDRPMSIYEVHLGSWRRVGDGGEQGRMLGYREIAAPLAAHAKEMGFTHVELMPVLEHPFYGSWGYGVTGFFAPTTRYGSAEDLMALVDTLHQAGLGVILDWVPAHFARDEHGLAMFDGGPTFEPSDPARQVHPVWSSGLFDYGRPEVRSFLLSSAIHWIETFHADGLRIDGVESILYVDRGRENADGIAFMRQLTGTLKLEHPDVVLAAEDASSWPGVTRAASAGGLGFDLKWDMGFSHDVRRYLAVDPIHRAEQQGVLTFRSVYAANEAYVLPLSHDDVVAERGGSLLEQMHGDPWQKLANLRLLYAFAYAQTGKKLLFMGNELAQSRAWHHDRSLDWHIATELPHAGIQRMVRDLNRLYRETPALHEADAEPWGFEWVDGSNASMSILTFLRRGTNPDDVVLVACNFTPVPRYAYRIGVPRIGHWREIFNSDAREYGGSGQGNLGGVDAAPYPWNGRESSIVATLPPLAIVFFAR